MRKRNTALGYAIFQRSGLRKGSATIEYVIVLPLVFVVVTAVLLVFLSLYQKSMVQSLADATAEGLSMVWGHQPLDVGDITTGSFKKTSFDAKEVYWQIKPGGLQGKEAKAEQYVLERLNELGMLRHDTFDAKDIRVLYQAGFPYSRIEVIITASYRVPGSRVLRFIGLGELMRFTCHAEATVFDQKEMINNTDYVIQIVKASKLGDMLEKFFTPLKNGLEQFIN